MASPFDQWLKHKFQSSNQRNPREHGESNRPGIPPPPPFCDSWHVISSLATTNLIPSNYGLFQHLPLEIRQQILGHAFGHRTLHVDLNFDHPLIRRPRDSPRHKKKIMSAFVAHRTRSNAATGTPHCGFGTNLIRDTRQPKQWQWFSCVCHRRVVREEEDDASTGRKPIIEPHEDGCIPGERFEKRARHLTTSPTLCRCETTDHNSPPTDDCFIGVMGWLLACRQAYHDGTDILYRTNTFHLSSLPLLLNLPRLMPSHHLASVTSAELLWTFNSPKLLNDDTLNQLWRSYTESLSASPPPDPSSPTTNLHRLATQLPTTLPNIRRLYIALQAHLPPSQPAAIPPINSQPTTTNTDNLPPNPNTHVLAAIEQAILNPIETAFRRLGLGPDKEFSVAVQRGGWEVFAEWLEGRGPEGGRRVFEVFDAEEGRGIVSYRERMWKPLLGGDGREEDGWGYWLCQGWDDFNAFGGQYWMYDLWGTGVRW